MRRGVQVEQLLGHESPTQDLSVVRWLTLSGAGGIIELRLHEAEDIGSSEFADVSAFPSVNPDDDYGEGVVIAASHDLDELLDHAGARGAIPNRWVNFGVIGEEYLDSRRP